jgi:hypothetical protein
MCQSLWLYERLVLRDQYVPNNLIGGMKYPQPNMRLRRGNRFHLLDVYQA